MQRRSYGPTAWMLDDVADPAGLALRISAASLSGVREVVPAESTVVVVCERSDAAVVGDHLDAIITSDAILLRSLVVDQADLFTVEVVYDGDDLGLVADATGLSIDEVISRHVAGHYRVAFCGFSPGFAYLAGLDPMLHLPRRTAPRTRVPAGAVAIAAGYSAVYPGVSPGGWHLIGTATSTITATLWDTHADPPAALWPGRIVRFRQAEA
ncbi:MAG TPA: carboxyltransferase domain-containing protein [Ilumatobacteraceae bacterium]|nr:carboxyltransferase domain-containing protein [Ilumatobacteraceae bacterium]